MRDKSSAPGSPQSAQQPDHLSLTALLPRLLHCRVCAGFDPSQLQQFANACQLHVLEADQPLPSADDDELVVNTVLSGRLKIYHHPARGAVRDMGYVNPGETVGQSSLVMEDFNRHIKVQADTRVQLAVMQRADTLRLMAENDQFRHNLFEIFRHRAKTFLSGKPLRRFPVIVAVFACHRQRRNTTAELALALALANEQVTVFSHRTAQLTTLNHAAVAIKPFTAQSHHQLVQQIRDSSVHCTRILLDIYPDASVASAAREDTLRLLDICDEVLWCCDNQQTDRQLERQMAGLVAGQQDLALRSRCIQLLAPTEVVGRKQPCCVALASADLMLPPVPLSVSDAVQGRLYRQGTQRVVHYLQGIKTGLALGGGGARGISHFGVLKVFDQADISFDLMSGTSIGALVGLGYAAGHEPMALMRVLAGGLKVGRRIEQMPSGERLFLFGKFQGGSWEPMLRRIFHDWTFEQLPIPFSVAVTDLVAGEQLIRNTGDITEAVLESINVPILSPPILRDGKILVDGGVLNNLPVDLLRAQAAEYVVGVNASKSIAREFAGNYAGLPSARMKTPNRFETAYRVLDVTRHAMAQAQKSLADYAIEPDTSAFDFADFSKSQAIADCGEQAALARLAQIHSALQQLQAIEPVHATGR